MLPFVLLPNQLPSAPDPLLSIINVPEQKPDNSASQQGLIFTPQQKLPAGKVEVSILKEEAKKEELLIKRRDRTCARDQIDQNVASLPNSIPLQGPLGLPIFFGNITSPVMLSLTGLEKLGAHIQSKDIDS